MPWMIVMIFLTLLDTLSSEVACIRLADIYWNATNPIFRIDNTDHIIDVNKGNLPFEYDQVNIICPVYPHSNHGTKAEEEEEDEDTERYIIYNVSKEEYDSCRITNPNPRIIAVCDKPHQLRYFTITFRSFTPQPGGLEFLPGHDYYFVSTSTGDTPGLHQRVGGRCATHNMKVIFKVCCGPSKDSAGSAPSNHQTSMVNVSVPASAPPTAVNNSSIRPLESKPLDRNVPYVVGGSTAAPQETSAPRWLRPVIPTRAAPAIHELRPYEVPIEDEMDKSPAKDKSKDKLAKIPKKDRAKNEELINGAASGLPPQRWYHLGAYYCIVACLLHHLLLALLSR